MTRESLSRRSFLTSSAAAGAFAALAPGAKVLGANQRLNIGCIGTGGALPDLMSRLARVPNVRIAAVCDVWDEHLGDGQEAGRPDRPSPPSIYKELLDRKDIDAVLIGTPDHWHVPMTIDACAAGKDVYVEKPLTHDLAEGQGRHRRAEQAQQDRAGRHAAAEHAAVPEGAARSSRRAGSARFTRST